MQTSGTYTSKKTNKEVSYTYEYEVYDTLQSANDVLGADKVLTLVQRMVKLDANNTAREKAKTANGDSTRKPLTEQEKQANKVQREQNKKMLDLLKGLSIEEVQQLLG